MHALSVSPSRPAHVAQTFELATPHAFDFGHTLGFLASFPATRGEQRTDGGVLTKALSLDGEAVLVRLTQAGGGLRVSVVSRAGLESDALARLGARIRFQLGLDEDLGPFRALAAADPPFAPVAARWHGHHHVKFPTTFEIATWAVLAQRNLRLGRRRKDALVARLGPALIVDGVEQRAFPEPGAVLAAPAALREAVADSGRADAILAIARSLSDPAFERSLHTLPIDLADARLRALPRIGPWSAAFILFRGLGRMERLADASGPIVEAARRVYGPESERELRARSARYGSWCGYWALYLRRR